jgi:hypothetical protein
MNPTRGFARLAYLIRIWHEQFCFNESFSEKFEIDEKLARRRTKGKETRNFFLVKGTLEQRDVEFHCTEEKSFRLKCLKSL